ncbi:MAG: ribosome biogenesis GTPase YlqF [Candidatus Melainabacteria bacterium]|nr:ribosome biogenesis GTPase YlqF [Candidatus Melainabacteria bacterium]
MPKPKPNKDGKGGMKPQPKSSTGVRKRPPSTAFQRLTEIVKWVDLVIEVLDGRLPVSTRHPKSNEIFGSKPRLIIYSKLDMSDSRRLKAYVKSVNEEFALSAENGGVQQQAVALCLKGLSSKASFVEACLALTKAKRESLNKKGLLPRPMRACVVGIPNVGKSSLINWFIGKKHARTGDMPGVTKGTQWIRVHPQLELLDTPGILPPTFFQKETMSRLSVLNLVPPDTYENLECAREALQLFKQYYPEALDKYLEGLAESGDGLNLLAEKRNFLTHGGKLDDYRAANILLRDIREGKLGGITLDEL